MDTEVADEKHDIVMRNLDGNDTIDEVRFYYETGELKAIQRRVNGIRHGYEEFYYPNGILKYKIYFIGDRPWSVEEGHTHLGEEVDLGTLMFGTGSWRTYYDDGTPEVLGYWKNNKVDSAWTFFNKNGSIRQVTNWSDGIENGTSLQYHSNGKIAGEVVYELGKKVSETHYHDNGTLFKELSYDEGLLNGECNEYYPIEGRLRQVRTYQGGLLEGEIKSYYRTGQIEWLGHMKMNNPVGYWKRYNKDGIIVEERQADSQLLRELSKEI